jgi:hypothetical protein
MRERLPCSDTDVMMYEINGRILAETPGNIGWPWRVGILLNENRSYALRQHMGNSLSGPTSLTSLSV